MRLCQYGNTNRFPKIVDLGASSNEFALPQLLSCVFLGHFGATWFSFGVSSHSESKQTIFTTNDLLPSVQSKIKTAAGATLAAIIREENDGRIRL